MDGLFLIKNVKNDFFQIKSKRVKNLLFSYLLNILFDLK